MSVEAILTSIKAKTEPLTKGDAEADERRFTTTEVILQAELQCASEKLKEHGESKVYQRRHYSVSTLSEEVIRMETGLPTKEVFDIVVRHVTRFKDSINYF